jgi:hypothetical protein
MSAQINMLILEVVLVYDRLYQMHTLHSSEESSIPKRYYFEGELDLIVGNCRDVRRE